MRVPNWVLFVGYLATWSIVIKGVGDETDSHKRKGWATICGYNDGTKMTKRGLIDAETRN
jgi:hypothetical protein